MFYQSRTFLPYQTPIIHIPWVPNTTPDSHGNTGGEFGPPINRMCLAWWPLERKTWEPDPIDPDVVARIENDIHILVKDPNIYKVLDMVQVNVSTNPSAPDWLTFKVQGLPTNWAAALPFPTMAYGMLIPGEIHCRRITDTGVLAGL
jgi:hypothetical protein